MDRFEKFIEIAAPLEAVFRAVSVHDEYPRWMHNINAVQKTRDGHLEWHGVALFDGEQTELRWTTETIIFEPDRRILWRSLEGDVTTDCEIILQETKHGSTRVRALRGFDIKSERAPEMDHAAMIEYQRLRLEEDLARLKQLVESRTQQSGDSSVAADAPHTGDNQQTAAESDAGKILRRGVDRLLDEPPSKNWRK